MAEDAETRQWQRDWWDFWTGDPKRVKAARVQAEGLRARKRLGVAFDALMSSAIKHPVKAALVLLGFLAVAELFGLALTLLGLAH